MSRLSTLPRDIEPKLSQLGALNFRDMGGWFLISNDWGHWLMLEPADFKRVMSGAVKEGEPLYTELAQRGFLRERTDFDALVKTEARRTQFRRFTGPSLHMIVVTLRCNLACHYCHSSVVDPTRTDTDMDLETAKRTVDFIFDTPNETICIEFQGGEPLLNWPVVKFVTEYAQAKAKGTGRRLIVTLVSNFNLMDEEKLDWLIDHHVSICTSLDGPAVVHEANRPRLGGGASHAAVIKWLRYIQKRVQEQPERGYYLPGALMTTTRASLAHGPEIVDVYDSLGMDQVFLRPLSPIGYAKRVWHDIGYSPAEFLKFYEDTLDYIVDLNTSGKSTIMERFSTVLLTKIVKGEDPGFMDLRSPAGAVLGCIAYNYDGNIFVSDEGRMVAHQGDPVFKVGHVRDPWESVASHPTTRALALASTMDSQPQCMHCAHKPFCGFDPVFHYEMQDSMTGRLPSSPWCEIRMGLLDIMFKKLRDPKTRAVFDAWLTRDECRWAESDAHEPGTPIQETAA